MIIESASNEDKLIAILSSVCNGCGFIPVFTYPFDISRQKCRQAKKGRTALESSQKRSLLGETQRERLCRSGCVVWEEQCANERSTLTLRCPPCHPQTRPIPAGASRVIPVCFVRIPLVVACAVLAKTSLVATATACSRTAGSLLFFFLVHMPPVKLLTSILASKSTSKSPVSPPMRGILPAKFGQIWPNLSLAEGIEVEGPTGCIDTSGV